MIESATKDGLSASVLSDPVTGQPLMLRTTTGAQSLYVYDGTPGSPIALLASSAYVAFAYDYDPFGVPTLTKDSGRDGRPQNPYTFAGGLQDRSTGWVHFGNRYYNAKTGSFTQQDALDAPLDPANANRYAYAANDPINNIDPTGNDTWDCINSFIGFGASAAGFEAALFVGGAASIASGGAFTPLAAVGMAASGIGLFSSAYSVRKSC